MNELIKFHILNNFYVRIQPIPHSIGCIVNFPANRFTKTLAIDKIYMLNNDPYSIDLYVLENNKSILTKNVPANNSNIRLLIVQDIILNTFRLGMSKDLVVVEESDKNLFGMLEMPQTREEKELETRLCVNFRELLAGNVVTSDIEGYEQVLLCFESGGL